MTIEIDDAGTGDPLLGAAIGFYRQETGELHFEWIPLEAYQEGTYTKHRPQEEAAKAVMRGLLKMNIKEDEKILLCQGSIFDKARESLDKANITHEPLKVEGKLQEAVEDEYINAIRKLGIRSKKLKVDEDNKEKGYKKRYFILLNWAKKNVKQREKYVKNGLPFWKYTKDQKRPIPGGWKRARKGFESKLEQILQKHTRNLNWGKLQNIIKSQYKPNGLYLNQRVHLNSKNPHKAKSKVSYTIQLYNAILSQLYFFLGEGFDETPEMVIWKSIMWKEDDHAVNGVMIYVHKDKEYKKNIRWFSFLREKAMKLLGSHIRFVVKPF